MNVTAMKRMILAAFVGTMLAGPLSAAQSDTQPDIEKSGVAWTQMTPDQKKVLQSFEKRWSKLPPQRQRRLAEGAARWGSMSPDERVQTRERFKKWQQLPEERRARVRERHAEFLALPPDEQARLRENYKRFQKLSPERRKQLRNRWRDATPEQRQRARELLRQRRANQPRG